MSDEAKPCVWLGMVGPGLQVLAVVAGVGIWALTSVGRSDNTAVVVAEMRKETRDALDKINTKLELLPGQQERVVQLGDRVREVLTGLAALEGRVGTVERGLVANASDIANIKAASGQRLRP